MGKGLNYWGEDDYTAAWGSEANYYYNYEDWNYGQGDMNHVGNQMMLLEHQTNTQQHDKRQDNPHDQDDNNQLTTVTSSYDPLRNAKNPAPIATHNKYHLLTNEEDEEDDSDSDENQRGGDAGPRRKSKMFNRNKRQRKKIQLAMTTQCHNTTQQQDVFFDDTVTVEKELMTPPWRRCRCAHEDDEAIRDAAASSGETENDWHALTNNRTTQCTNGEYNNGHDNHKQAIQFG